MSKFWKQIKKTFASLLIFLLIFNPFVPALVSAEEVTPEPSPSPTAVIETGTAVSTAVSVSETNTTSVESQVDTAIIPITSDTDQTVVPFPLPVDTSPSPIPSPSPDVVPTESQNVSVDNQAAVETTSEAVSNTGDNSQTSMGDAQMTTGDAVAVATSLSLTNTTLINSTLQVGVILILDEWYGDIVIDPPSSGQLAIQNESSGGSSIAINNDFASVTTIASASATTGDNTQTAGGDAMMTTGEASAISQANTIANMTLMNADVFAFLPENIWLWSGTIRNWESPGSVMDAAPLLYTTSQNDAGCSNSCNTDLSVTNQASVTTTAVATSSTGGNTQTATGEATMNTGDAYAAAVATSMVNTTLIDSRYRQLSLLLFAPWRGNLIFAYPDLQISASAPAEVYEGEDIICDVTINNAGYALDDNVSLRLSARDDNTVVYGTDDAWGQLLPISTTTRSYKIATTGLAGRAIVIDARVNGDKAEESTTNNQVTINTVVLPRPSSQTNSLNNDEILSELPKLRLTSINNIHDFVYPGDGITYDMIVYNDGPTDTKNSMLVQRFFTPEGELISEFTGKIGDLPLNGRKSIRFVMRTGIELGSGNYYTESVVVAQSDHGEDVRSNTVLNSVVFRLKQIVQEVLENKVEAAESIEDIYPTEGEVLGTTAPTPNRCDGCISFPWYVAITLGTVMYYIISSKQRDFGRSLRWGLVLPLSAYGGLIYSNPYCSQGIVMLPSASNWCLWFLPASYAMYFGIMSFFRFVSHDTVLRVSWRPSHLT